MIGMDQAAGLGSEAVTGEVKPMVAASANRAVKMVRLGDACEKVAKWDPKSRPTEQFFYVDLGAVSSEHKAITNAALIEGKDAPSRARQLITADDILVATVRPNLNAVARVQQAYDAATASTGFCVLRPSRTIDSQYLFH